MENSEFKKVRAIIDDIKKARLEINAAIKGISNAEFRISKDTTNSDEMWTKIKKEYKEKLDFASTKFNFSMKKLINCKKMCSHVEWNYLLEELGIVLAQTENINHVADSLYDAYDLKSALDETAEMIENKNKELNEAYQNNNEDLIVIIKSELEYYDKDMRRHPWGEARLKNLYYNEERKNRLGSR